MLKKVHLLTHLLMAFAVSAAFAQTNEWATQYVTFDDAVNGPGLQTASVAVVGENDFVALVAGTPSGDIFSTLTANYLVGYFQADSGFGRTITDLPYGSAAQGRFETWESGLDQVQLRGAWQIAGDRNNRVYVANNDADHNILVFELSGLLGLLPTEYRMITGSENIFAIDVDSAGYVYVVDYRGTDQKTDELKIFAPIGTPGTTWGDFGGHNDPPVATIDLPPGTYQGVTAKGDGSTIFVSHTSGRRILKYIGDRENGYTLAPDFESAALAETDTIGNGGFGKPSFLGLAYSDRHDLVFAAADSFIHIGGSGGYPYGRIYVIDPKFGALVDTVDIAAWNLAKTGSYSTGSSNGRVGGFTSVCDVDFWDEDGGLYTQTYYGWAVEKWLFDGDLGTIVSVEQVAETIPAHFELRQNYPNPFNPSTTITFDVVSAAQVRLAVYNTLGQVVATLVNEALAPGTYQATFDAGRLPSGLYFYRLEAGTFTATRKMILTR